MTREEIKNIPELVDLMLDKCVLADSRTKVCKRLKEVCDLAIKALEQEPCGNAISKDKVFDILDYWYDDDSDGYVQACKSINELPPVHPIRPSVIEDIKAEINQKREENRNGEYDKIFELCLLIIDKYTSGKEHA